MRTPAAWDDVFMNMARALATRSKDDSSQFAAVVTDQRHRILGTGFNGPPPQLVDELVPWAVRGPEAVNKYDFVVHAEENAILAALDGHGSAALAGGGLYVTGVPCPGCVLRAVRAGLKTFWYDPAGEWKGQTLRHWAAVQAILAAQKGPPEQHLILVPYTQTTTPTPPTPSPP